MAVQCANCGEQLLGSVNRCWRCGQEFVARSGDVDIPPIRRSPVKSDNALLVAELAEQEPGESSSLQQDSGPPAPSAMIRRGSPFADRGTATMEQVAAPAESETPTEAPLQPRYPRYGGSIAGVALTFPLGLLSLLVAFLFPIGGLILAAAGIALGVWGLYSRHRGLALAGILLCCLSLALAGFNGAVELYERIHGVSPWETSDPLSP
jgi:hypothetical protein